ncbi:GNAT family N-acetyltransferase [Microvirga aerophila]|uniref:N-acetyltransferase n=1 Tax=Microvirga aerophila TaxID=670291 RepID=A0A512BYD7_9HYPH|nr:GNAT family N-acetyltransferase [Microvirga aerophila]GEO16965.1 N-acetyltransferase [Microvirga aerophila]
MANTVRLAHPGDESLLDAFLAQHADSSLHLRSFLTRGGLVDEGKPLQGTYAIALSDGHIVGVAMHSWHNVVFLQAPGSSAELARVAIEATGRPLLKILGSLSQVETAHAGLGLEEQAIQRQSRVGMFVLNLSDLIAPGPLGSSSTSCRRAKSEDLALLREWRFSYELESTGLPDTDTTRSLAAQMIEGHVARKEAFLLEVGDIPVSLCTHPVSLCTHMVRVSDIVQIGGVWTPPEWRGRGYARRVVAGALQIAEQEGVTRAVLFTESPAARRCYEALGFQRVGDYSTITYATDTTG